MGNLTCCFEKEQKETQVVVVVEPLVDSMQAFLSTPSSFLVQTLFENVWKNWKAGVEVLEFDKTLASGIQNPKIAPPPQRSTAL